MELILLEKIHKLGGLGEVVKVKPGFGRNYLVPQGKAIPANKANLAIFEQKRAELEKRAAEVLKDADVIAKKLQTEQLEISVQVGPQGKLYGSITVTDVLALLTERGYELSKRQLIMSDDVIRKIGEYNVNIHLHPDVNVDIPLLVVDAAGPAEPEEVASEAEFDADAADEGEATA